MMTDINREMDHVHPLLADVIRRIEIQVIKKHALPFKVFETSRTSSRHKKLLDSYKTRDVMSRHLYDYSCYPRLECTAVDYVMYIQGKWSWNIRDATVVSFYHLFGNLVLDSCPELIWKGNDRKAQNFTHFELRESIIRNNIGRYPCVVPGYN